MRSFPSKLLKGAVVIIAFLMMQIAVQLTMKGSLSLYLLKGNCISICGMKFLSSTICSKLRMKIPHDNALFKDFDYESNISSYVKEIKSWKHGIKFAVWDPSYHFNAMSFTKKSYNEDWKTLLKMFKLSFCNAVDIGANDGKI